MDFGNTDMLYDMGNFSSTKEVINMSEKKCYYCGSLKVSREHAPPKQLFKGFICDKITVPSCEKHNKHKSFDDESIIKAMLISLDNLSEKYKYEKEIKKLINSTKPYFPQVKKTVKSELISDKLPKDLKYELAHLSGNIDIEEWIKQITAALVYSVIKRYDPANKFKEAFVFLPFWIPNSVVYKGLKNIKKELKRKKHFKELFEGNEWSDGWSSGKNNYPASIYKFFFSIVDEFVIFKHVFLKQYNWYVVFEASDKTKKMLLDHI